jgi:hypothetical protein
LKRGPPSLTSEREKLHLGVWAIADIFFPYPKRRTHDEQIPFGLVDSSPGGIARGSKESQRTTENKPMNNGTWNGWECLKIFAAIKQKVRKEKLFFILHSQYFFLLFCSKHHFHRCRKSNSIGTFATFPTNRISEESIGVVFCVHSKRAREKCEYAMGCHHLTDHSVPWPFFGGYVN